MSKKNKTPTISRAELYAAILQYSEAEIANTGDCMHIMPTCGREHDADGECWCQPMICVQAGMLPVALHYSDN